MIWKEVETMFARSRFMTLIIFAIILFAFYCFAPNEFLNIWNLLYNIVVGGLNKILIYLNA